MSDTVLSPVRAARSLGRYELIEVLGQGGMGEVHLARLSGAAGFEKLCIVKTVLPALLKDPQFLERFQHEAKVLVHLSHANIAQVYDMGEVEGSYFMALEYVAGVDLGSLLDRLRAAGQRVAIPIALYVGQKLAEGLGYAHRKAGADGRALHIVHRDVSPQNVMVSFEGEVKIIDFGLAKSTVRSRQTQTPTVMGKLGYMSPEQARADAVDARSDIYSAGVIVWEMLAGRPLVAHGTSGEMLAAMASPRVPALTLARPEVTAELEAAVARALAPSCADRYPSADDFARALAEISLRSGGFLTAPSVGEFVRATCPESFATHQRLVSRLSTLRDPPAPIPVAPIQPEQRALVAPASPVGKPAAPKHKTPVVWIVLGSIALVVLTCMSFGRGLQRPPVGAADRALRGRAVIKGAGSARALAVFNTDVRPWSDCTLTLPGGRPVAMGALLAGEHREMPLRSLIAEGAGAVSGVGMANVSCREGSALFPTSN